jgi:hypothetical protein
MMGCATATRLADVRHGVKSRGGDLQSYGTNQIALRKKRGVNFVIEKFVQAILHSRQDHGVHGGVHGGLQAGVHGVAA